jgi:archaellum component FlaG (FlaF/FlaG flagellin family)
VLAASSSSGLVMFVAGMVVVAASLLVGLVLRNLGKGQKKVQR